MSSEDLKTLQPDAFAALKQLVAQSPSAAAALQMQLAQAQGQLRKDGLPARVPAIAGEQCLVFSLADSDFAVKAELVQGVERLGEITSVPNVVPWVRGVVNLRGSIVSVVDLRMFLGLEGVSYTPRTRLLSLQYKEMVICLIVDGVSEMLPIPASVITNGNVRQAIPSWAIPYASGSALLANRLMVILDVPRLLFSEKMHQYAL
ncbi:MAG TPA: chemotaxis protein CheW [Ktedonobacteraceae bacterium]|nr:chemotaxis protein CheW [Ktedonobacteraceae bacterium]